MTESVKQVMFSVPQVAEQWGISPRQVWRLIERGELDTTRFGRCVRISKSAMDSFVAAQGEAM